MSKTFKIEVTEQQLRSADMRESIAQQVDPYAGYDLLPIDCPKREFMGNARAYELFDLMRSLGFSRVQSHIVYRGPVASLVDLLKRSGWVLRNHPDNPYLLCRDDCRLTVNYAESADAPSADYVSVY